VTILDRRLHAFRPDLADIRLSGDVVADRFVEGRPARVTAPVADLRARPDPDAGCDTQLLMGADISVFDAAEGWAWVQAHADGYVGYMRADLLGAEAPPPTHRVVAPRSFVYAEPDLKRSAHMALSMGSRVAIAGHAERRGTLYAMMADGSAMIASHVAPLAAHAVDYVAVAETLEHTPYLWGGASAFGIDCSGLVQLSMSIAGRRAQRDSDMQASGLGDPVDPGPAGSLLSRGDLVFWHGHVAIVTGPGTIIHANGHTMTVAREGLSAAIERISYLYGQPTGYRRP
jgi:cell wall-associated NlpC family hydrolase